mgnify:CR=1 FL=1
METKNKIPLTEVGQDLTSSTEEKNRKCASKFLPFKVLLGSGSHVGGTLSSAR